MRTRVAARSRSRPASAIRTPYPPMLLQLADSGQSRPPAPARRRPLSALHPEPATGFRPQDDLSCFFQPTIQTRPAKKRLVHAEHEILIFLYIKRKGGTAEAKATCTLVPLSAKATVSEQRFTENANNQRVLVQMTFSGDQATQVLEP